MYRLLGHCYQKPDKNHYQKPDKNKSADISEKQLDIMSNKCNCSNLGSLYQVKSFKYLGTFLGTFFKLHFHLTIDKLF